MCNGLHVPRIQSSNIFLLSSQTVRRCVRGDNDFGLQLRLNTYDPLYR